MYSDVFCKVYNEFGWNYYPEAFGHQLLDWLKENGVKPESALDLGCGTGVLCELLHKEGIRAAGMDLSEGMISIARASCPEIRYDVADMTAYRPDRKFDLVTCTGDAVNHIPELTDVEAIFRNVYGYLSQGGYFIFDLLNESEVSDSEPFEMDYDENTRVWFQMTRPAEDKVNLKIKVFEQGAEAFEENILAAVDEIVVVVKADGYSQDGLQIFRNNLKDCQKRKRINPVFKTIVLNEVNKSYKLANEIIEALKNTDFNIVEIPQDQNFKSATIFRKTIQQQGAKQNTLDAFKKLADLVI